MIIDAIKTFIENNCPLVSGKKINVNYLGEKPQRYTIESVPSTPIIKKYSDGGTQRQYLWVFSSRENYDAEARENLNIARFYEEFSSWIEEQNKNKNLPLLDGATPLRLEVLTSGYLFRANTDTARYQIQCRLIYYKGAN